jgi:hypothetical protein
MMERGFVAYRDKASYVSLRDPVLGTVKLALDGRIARVTS